MHPNEYCPMGSPSLLNGDFFENVARLKDFSWSVFFSSAPNNIIIAKNATGANGTTSTHNATLPTKTTTTEPFFLLPEDYKLIAPGVDETLLFICYVGPTIYIFVIVLICKKLSSCVKVTRDRLVKAACFISFGYIVSLFWMFASKMFPVYDMVFMPCLGYFAVYQMATLHAALFFVTIDNFRPRGVSMNRNAWITSIILAVLLFIFAPVHRPDECPPEREREIAELFFLISFVFFFYGVFFINYFYIFYSAKELDILKNHESVGKLVKKEGFGWIEYLNEDENDDNEQTIIQLT